MADSKFNLEDFDAILFDCDGVLWRGNDLVPGADETLRQLRAMGKRLVFVTNNSSKSREGYLPKFASMNIEANKEEVFTSSYAAAAYLASLNFSKKAFFIGEGGVGLELQEHGIPYIHATQLFGKNLLSKSELENIQTDPEIGAVVVGIDTEFTYPKLAYAFRCLQQPDTLFIATNTDNSLPVPTGLLPGGGTMVAAVQTCSRKTPLVMGKPEPLLLDIIVQKFGLDRSRTLMVGDKLDTDILFGNRGGLKTLLVLSGVTSLEESRSHPDIQPHFVMESVADLIPHN